MNLALESAINEWEVIDNKINSLIELDQRLRQKGTMSAADAIAVDNAFPGGVALESFYTVGSTRAYVKSLEEASLGIVAAIIAGAAAAAYAIYQLWNYFKKGSGKKSDSGDTGGGGGGYQLPIESEVKETQQNLLENVEKVQKEQDHIIELLREHDLILAISMDTFKNQRARYNDEFIHHCSNLKIMSVVFGKEQATAGDVALANNLAGVSKEIGRISAKYLSRVNDFFRTNPDTDSVPAAEKYKSMIEETSAEIDKIIEDLDNIRSKCAAAETKAEFVNKIYFSTAQWFPGVVKGIEEMASRLRITNKINSVATILNDAIDRAESDKAIKEEREKIPLKNGTALSDAVKGSKVTIGQLEHRFKSAEKNVIMMLSKMHRDNLEMLSFKIAFYSFCEKAITDIYTRFKAGEISREDSKYVFSAFEGLNKEKVDSILETIGTAKNNVKEDLTGIKSESKKLG